MNKSKVDYEAIRRSEEKCEELREAAMPLLAFLNKYYNPHTYAVVAEGRVEIVEGDMFAPLPIRD